MPKSYKMNGADAASFGSGGVEHSTEVTVHRKVGYDNEGYEEKQEESVNGGANGFSSGKDISSQSMT